MPGDPSDDVLSWDESVFRDERVFDDPHVFENFDERTGRAKTVVPADERREIYDRLYRELRLTRVRPGPDGGIEVANDNGDPEVTDLSRFDFSWKLTDAHIDYVAEAMSRGAEVHFVSPSVEDWMETESGSPAEYAEWAMAMLRRWRDRGYEPPYYALLNEPGFFGRKETAWQGDGPYGFSGEYLRDAAKLLGAKLRSEGFATKLVIPDDINPSEAFERARVVLEDPGARRYVGAIATHLYGGPMDRSLHYDGLDELRSLDAGHTFTDDETDVVLIARGDDFPDAITGSAAGCQPSPSSWLQRCSSSPSPAWGGWRLSRRNGKADRAPPSRYRRPRPSQTIRSRSGAMNSTVKTTHHARSTSRGR
jgi:hypothetical protein